MRLTLTAAATGALAVLAAAVFAPGHTEQVLRVACVAVVAGAAADLGRAVLRDRPLATSDPFRPRRAPVPADPVPAELARLRRDVAAMAPSGPPRAVHAATLRGILTDVARRRLARRGIDLDDPAQAAPAESLLGSDVWAFVAGRAPVVDPAGAASALEEP